MRTVAQLFLNFLLNAIWQIAAIALAAGCGNYLLRPLTRFRHVMWVVALTMSLLLPLVSAFVSLRSESRSAVSQQNVTIEPVTTVPANIVLSDLPPTTARASSAFHVSQRIAFGLLAAFLILAGYRSARLLRAWIKTRAIRRAALPFAPAENLRSIVQQCQKVFGVSRVRLLSSRSLKVPATVGIFDPLVILPEDLLGDSDTDALAAAVGHEMVHVARRDYLLNLIYELIFLPLSFHPAAALIKRQIIKTRELRCDELVAQRLLHPEVYARSLVRLAGWAMPLNRRPQTIIVGMADADILEVRVMSLLKKTKSSLRRNILLLIAAALLLAIPCVASASFGLNFNIDPAGAGVQEPSSGAQEKKEMRDREALEREMKERAEKEDLELKQKIERETNPEVRAKLETLLRRRLEDREKQGYAVTFEGKSLNFMIDEEGARREREIEAKRNVELAKAAKISMDQAIQIATSSTPGKVLECSLVGERWKEPGELAKPSRVLYHVVILSGDEPNTVTNHVLVNAVDGSIFRSEKEERKIENPEYLRQGHAPIEGGKLNGNAIALPNPEYPDIARAARAEGSVTVQIMIDETGHVISARAVSGHSLLQAAAVTAARQAVFAPTRLKGEPVKVTGALIYNFVAQ
jgi:TonB family protein